ncbi:MAG: hypothetical protein M3R37_13015 [Actinomycetota bacterium]|nr:hypothetical protein [Actinomycetota bacterium]
MPASGEIAVSTLVWAIAAAVAFVLVIVLGEQNQGTSERIYLAIYVSWLVAVSVRLMRFGGADLNSGVVDPKHALPAE